MQVHSNQIHASVMSCVSVPQQLKESIIGSPLYDKLEISEHFTLGLKHKDRCQKRKFTAISLAT